MFNQVLAGALIFGSLTAGAAAAKARVPANVNCDQTAQSAAVKRASEAIPNCKTARIEGKKARTAGAVYTVLVSCPAFAGDSSEYAFEVTTKVAFGTGTGQPICFAQSIDPISAPLEAVTR